MLRKVSSVSQADSAKSEFQSETASGSISSGRSSFSDLKTLDNLEQRHLNSQHLYIIDFGLAKFFVDQNTGLHIPQRKINHFVGTASFSSLNSHKMQEQSRRDDLESLANMMVFLRKGRLPWLRAKITP